MFCDYVFIFCPHRILLCYLIDFVKSELKPLILRLAENCVTLRNWIVILIPKAEDGNNFGVEVQEQCIVKLIG